MTRLVEWWRSHKAQIQALFEEYGSAAIAVWLVVFAGTFLVFFGLVQAGVDPAGAVGSAGTVGAAYVATRLTFPIRVIARVGITPVAVRWYRRFRARSS